MDVEIYNDVFDRFCYKVSSPKIKMAYLITPHPSGYQFYMITTEGGQTPKSLGGKFSSPDAALKALKHYDALRPKSKTVRRDENTQRRIAQKNAAKLQSDSKE